LMELHDVDQVWELRCSCLDFIATCLSTFNEDLVVFANTTSINVDSVMATSSLSAYVRLHPFARVMEWLFNDGVINSLFASAHADVDSASAVATGSPMLTSLCRSIEIIELILKLQYTYFDIVRPIVKTQAATRSRQVANPAIASFEDAILSNPRLIADLCLYCGTGHRDLTLVSISLLRRLSMSRKLSSTSAGYGAGRSHVNRLIISLQQDSDVERITGALIGPIHLDPHELELGDRAPGFAIKQAILDLLDGSLQVAQAKPGLAHCLLGFTCNENSVSIATDGRMARGGSLFHAVARLYAETAALEEAHAMPWLSSTRRSAGAILRKLIRSVLTSSIVLAELRETGFRETLAIAQRPATASTSWAGRTYDDPEFLVSDSSSVFRDFLLERAAFFEFSSLEMRAVTEINAPSQQQKILSSLFGVTALPDGERVQNASIFDLSDFGDMEVTFPFSLPTPKYMTGLDLAVCRTGESEDGTIYDLRLVSELLLLREADLSKNGQLIDTAAAQQVKEETEALMLCLQAENQHSTIQKAQQAVLKAWVQLMTVILETGDLELAQKSTFTLQALQVVLPKVDAKLAQDSLAALPLMKLVYTLVLAQGVKPSASMSTDVTAATERLFHAFKTALSGVTSAMDNTDMREISYQIGRHFLKTILNKGSTQGTTLKHAMKMIDSAGERLVDTMCDDALSSQGSCKVAAMLVLEPMVQLYQASKSSHVVRTMNRLNFIAVLVDSIRSIADEFGQENSGAGKWSLEHTQCHQILIVSRYRIHTSVHTCRLVVAPAIITGQRRGHCAARCWLPELHPRVSTVRHRS